MQRSSARDPKCDKLLDRFAAAARRQLDDVVARTETAEAECQVARIARDGDRQLGQATAEPVEQARRHSRFTLQARTDRQSIRAPELSAGRDLGRGTTAQDADRERTQRTLRGSVER